MSYYDKYIKYKYKYIKYKNMVDGGGIQCKIQMDEMLDCAVSDEKNNNFYKCIRGKHDKDIDKYLFYNNTIKL